MASHAFTPVSCSSRTTVCSRIWEHTTPSLATASPIRFRFPPSPGAWLGGLDSVLVTASSMRAMRSLGPLDASPLPPAGPQLLRSHACPPPGCPAGVPGVPITPLPPHTLQRLSAMRNS